MELFLAVRNSLKMTYNKQRKLPRRYRGCLKLENMRFWTAYISHECACMPDASWSVLTCPELLCERRKIKDSSRRSKFNALRLILQLGRKLFLNTKIENKIGNNKNTKKIVSDVTFLTILCWFFFYKEDLNCKVWWSDDFQNIWYCWALIKINDGGIFPYTHFLKIKPSIGLRLLYYSPRIFFYLISE